MKARLLLNLVLAFTIAGIAFFILDKSATKPATENLASLINQKISRIVIQRENGDIEFSHTANGWQMLSPHQVRAHDFRIKHLLNLLETPILKSYDIDELALESYGLKPPRASIRYNDIEILFGNTNPVNNWRYLQTENKLLLVYEEIYPLLSAQPTSFVDLFILPGERKINRLTLPGLQLSSSDKGWLSDGQQSITADQITELVNNWQSAQAFGVHIFMQRKQLGEIKIQLDNGELVQLEITDDTPWLILADPARGIEYHLDSGLKEKLFPGFETASDSNDA